VPPRRGTRRSCRDWRCYRSRVRVARCCCQRGDRDGGFVPCVGVSVLRIYIQHGRQQLEQHIIGEYGSIACFFLLQRLLLIPCSFLLDITTYRYIYCILPYHLPPIVEARDVCLVKRTSRGEWLRSAQTKTTHRAANFHSYSTSLTIRSRSSIHPWIQWLGVAVAKT
jgi:hypothetical protein